MNGFLFWRIGRESPLPFRDDVDFPKEKTERAIFYKTFMWCLEREEDILTDCSYRLLEWWFWCWWTSNGYFDRFATDNNPEELRIAEGLCYAKWNCEILKISFKTFQIEHFLADKPNGLIIVLQISVEKLRNNFLLAIFHFTFLNIQ